MKIELYQKKSSRTMKIDDSTVQHCCLGISGEAGEVIDLIKKSIYYNKTLDRAKVTEELGDLMFYIVNLASALDIRMDTVLRMNVDKLYERFPNGFSKKEAIERKDESGE